jgi:hypothetical protein
LPIFGPACDLPIATLAQRLDAMNGDGLAGRNVPDPLLSLITLTGAAILLRICEEGLEPEGRQDPGSFCILMRILKLSTRKSKTNVARVKASQVMSCQANLMS